MEKRGRPKTRDGICAKCRRSPSLAGQSWCSGCFKEYEDNRRATGIEQASIGGFSRGVEAMRQTLADEFERYDIQTGGRGMLEIERVVSIIRLAPRPVLQRGSVGAAPIQAT